MAEGTKTAIADGTIHPFQGPFMKEEGTVTVKQGETAPTRRLSA